MKIAIHHRPGSFSDRWIAYCQQKSIDYKIVNCYDSDIVEQVKDCDALMWHHHHADYKDALTAKRILFALEHAGVKVFPNFHTGWHFDDKVAQKYLLEAIDAPLVPSYVFYDKNEALDWAETTTYPKVFKLKGGAGSSNVKLVRSKKDAVKLINTAFGKGFSQFNRLGNLKERYRKYKSGKDTLLGVAKGVGRLVIPTEFAKLQSRERGYVYFQEFVENDGFDVRVVVIGHKAVALKRLVRENDFRASGSGNLIFENEKIDKEYIIKAFDLSRRIKSQSLAIDFIQSKDNEVLIVELSYGFPMLNFLDGAAGYWDSSLQWHEGKFNPQEWMVKEIISNLNI